MRRFLLAMVMCGMTAGAQAADLADLPILRGGFTEGLTRTSVNWSGVYIGGHVSHGGADMDFANSGQDLLAKLLNNVDVETQFNISKWPVGETAAKNRKVGEVGRMRTGRHPAYRHRQQESTHRNAPSDTLSRR